MGRRLEEIRNSKMSPNRRFVYDFMELPHIMKLQIAVDLGLSKKGDESLADSDRFIQYFHRAQDRGKLELF